MSRTLWRWIALSSFTGLFILLSMRIAWLAPPPEYLPRSLALLLLVGPLLLPLPGVIHGRLKAHLWAAILAMFYFVLGVYHWAGAADGLASMEILLSILLFISANLYVRSYPRGTGNPHQR